MSNTSPQTAPSAACVFVLVLCLAFVGLGHAIDQISVHHPVEGEVYYAGDTMHIQWTGGDGVRIWLQCDPEGEWWGRELTNCSAGDSIWGDFPWMISDSLDSTPTVFCEECRIVVTEMGNCTGNHDYSGTFAILPWPESNDVVLLSPGGGEIFAVGDTLPIQWEGGESGGADIRLSVDGGETWGRIDHVSSQDPRWGDYGWIVPAVPCDLDIGTVLSFPSPTCRIQVSETNRGSWNCDESGNFTVRLSDVRCRCAGLVAVHEGPTRRAFGNSACVRASLGPVLRYGIVRDGPCAGAFRRVVAVACTLLSRRKVCARPVGRYGSRTGRECTDRPWSRACGGCYERFETHPENHFASDSLVGGVRRAHMGAAQSIAGKLDAYRYLVR